METLKELVTENDGFHLEIAEDPERIMKLSEVIAQLERIRMLDEWGHRDFMNEVRWTPEEAIETKDGIDLATVELSQSDIAGMRLVRDPRAITYLREWNKGQGLLTMGRKGPIASSALCLIWADEHSQQAVFNGGRILERAWLYVNSRNIAMQPVSPATFIFYRLVLDDPYIRSEFREDMIEWRKVFKETLQLPEESNDLFLFRLFYADEPEVKSYRYPIEEVLRIKNM
jgi:hypothetical protein